MKKAAALAMSGFIVLGACAEKASNIEAAAISTAAYDGWSCTKLSSEKAFVDSALVQKSAVQDKAASTDAWMVFLIGIPTSGGGIAGEVASLKGQQEALRQALRDKNCG